MSEKPPITTVAGQVLSDEDQTPEARRLAGAVLNQAREDQADDHDSEAVEGQENDQGGGEPIQPDSGVAGEIVDSEAGGITGTDNPSGDNFGGNGDPGGSDMAGTGTHQLSTIDPERRAELETERTNLQRKHAKMLDEPGYARTLLAVQARLAEIDAELGD